MRYIYSIRRGYICILSLPIIRDIFNIKGIFYSLTCNLIRLMEVDLIELRAAHAQYVIPLKYRSIAIFRAKINSRASPLLNLAIDSLTVLVQHGLSHRSPRSAFARRSFALRLPGNSRQPCNVISRLPLGLRRAKFSNLERTTPRDDTSSSYSSRSRGRQRYEARCPPDVESERRARHKRCRGSSAGRKCSQTFFVPLLLRDVRVRVSACLSGR